MFNAGQCRDNSLGTLGHSTVPNAIFSPMKSMNAICAAPFVGHWKIFLDDCKRLENQCIGQFFRNWPNARVNVGQFVGHWGILDNSSEIGRTRGSISDNSSDIGAQRGPMSDNSSDIGAQRKKFRFMRDLPTANLCRIRMVQKMVHIMTD